MSELLRILNQNETGWLFSGIDKTVMLFMLRNILAKARRQGFIQAIILTEDILPAINPLLEQEINIKAYIPSHVCGYLPVFSAESDTAKNRFIELFQTAQDDAGSVNQMERFIHFTMELEEYTGDSFSVDEKFFRKYLKASAVDQTMNEAVACGRLDMEDYGDLQSEYANCSDGRVNLKNFIKQLESRFFIKNDKRQSMTDLYPGEGICFVIKADMPESVRKMLFKMIGWDILDAERGGSRVCVSVLEGSKKYGEELLHLFETIGVEANCNLFAQDFFWGHSDEWKNVIEGYFQQFAYSKHKQMESCDEISNIKFGTLPIVRRTHSVDKDRRIGNNRGLDVLLGTNRVDHYVEHVPVWEPVYRKEEIYEMPVGVCLIKTNDYEGYVRCDNS